MLSTQIGAQKFTDPLALMSPGDPEQAAALIRAAASVSHDGVALDCAARGLRRYYAALFGGGDRVAIVARRDDAGFVIDEGTMLADGFCITH